MRDWIKRGAVVAVAAGLVASPGIAGAGAHGASFESKIRITNFVMDMGGNSFIGKIGSENPNCKPDRKGKIFRKRPGDDELIGTGTSNNQGRFAVPVAGKPVFGRYYAKVGKDLIPAGTCKGDVSGTFELG